MFSHGRRNNSHLASNRRNDPSCLNFGDYLVGVWRVSGMCLEGVLRVSGRCLEGVLIVSVSMGSPNGNLVISQGRSSKVQIKSGYVN